MFKRGKDNGHDTWPLFSQNIFDSNLSKIAKNCDFDILRNIEEYLFHSYDTKLCNCFIIKLTSDMY